MLQVWQGKTAPAANFSQLNPNISFAGTPLHVPALVGEQAGEAGPLTGLVNSLGIGGTNCALLIEGVEQPKAAGQSTAKVVYLGAFDQSSLKAYASQLSTELANTEYQFDDIAFTLTRRAVGKDYRVAIEATNTKELIQALQHLPVEATREVVSLADYKGHAVELRSTELDLSVEVSVEAKVKDSAVILEKRASVKAESKPAQHSLAKVTEILNEIWCDNLMIDEVSSVSSFLDEGGHSMMALSFIDDIKDHLSFDLSLDWVDEHDTFNQQLDALMTLVQQTGERKSYVRLLRAAQGKPRARLIMVHASISGAEAYKVLAQQIAPDVEVLAVDSHNLYADESAIIDDLQTLTDLYSQDILASVTDKSTPVVLGGWSLGGMMAHVIYDKISASLPVKALFALDSVIYNASYNSLYSDDNLKYFMDVENLFAKGSDGVSNQKRRLYKVFKAERKMAVSFTAQPLNVPMLNVVATRSKNDIDHEQTRTEFKLAKLDNGWKVSGVIATEFVTTDHEGIVERASSEQVSNLINRCIADNV